MNKKRLSYKDMWRKNVQYSHESDLYISLKEELKAWIGEELNMLIISCTK